LVRILKAYHFEKHLSISEEYLARQFKTSSW